MQDFKQEIKNWLKVTGKNRFWLAEQCFVGKNQIDKWLSTTEIPPAKKAIIEHLINNESKEKNTELEEEQITLRFAGTELVLLRNFMAKHPDIDITEYLRAKAIEFAIGLEKAETGKQTFLSSQNKSHPSGTSPDPNVITGDGSSGLRNLSDSPKITNRHLPDAPAGQTNQP